MARTTSNSLESLSSKTLLQCCSQLFYANGTVKLDFQVRTRGQSHLMITTGSEKCRRRVSGSWEVCQSQLSGMLYRCTEYMSWYRNPPSTFVLPSLLIPHLLSFKMVWSGWNFSSATWSWKCHAFVGLHMTSSTRQAVITDRFFKVLGQQSLNSQYHMLFAWRHFPIMKWPISCTSCYLCKGSRLMFNRSVWLFDFVSKASHPQSDNLSLY